MNYINTDPQELIKMADDIEQIGKNIYSECQKLCSDARNLRSGLDSTTCKKLEQLIENIAPPVMEAISGIDVLSSNIKIYAKIVMDFRKHAGGD